MALRNYVTHPADGSLEVAHVVGGHLQVGASQPLPVTTEQGAPFSVRTVDLITVNNTTVPILSIQHDGVGALAMKLRQWEAYNDGRDVAFLDLVVGGTLTGAAFAPVDAGSEFEVDTAATALVGGTVIASLIVGRDTSRDLTGDINSALALNLGNPGPLTVMCTDQTGNRSVQVATLLSWLES
jgi:hypothetical protein